MAKFEHVPEEKLLNLIEGNKKFVGLKRRRKNRISSIFGKVKKIWAVPSFIYRTIKINISKLKNRTNSGRTNLKPVISVLTIAAVVLLGYLIMDFSFGSPDISDINQRLAVRRKLSVDSVESEGRSFVSYSTMLQRRNIFSPIAVKDSKSGEEEGEKELKQKIRELSADLRLAGISLSPEPQVMIENEKTNETFFLKKGDTINKLTVDQIVAEGVVLEYRGKTLKLF